MCGILGQINKNSPVDAIPFEEALNALYKRGPDDAGIFIKDNIGLGHRRLSIVDLSQAGRQPMFNQKGDIAIIFNGEIYNYLNLRSQVESEFLWQSRTDTEVLLHLYEKKGQKMVNDIEGMFAFCIMDFEKGVATFARDHFGKKPLYYFHDENTFCFASEIKALLKLPEVKEHLKVDYMSLVKYLFYGYVPSPNSIFSKIKKLPPATTLQFDFKNWEIINEHIFWSLENVQPKKFEKEADLLSEIEVLLKASVKKRLMADVPLGVFLSGGVDSSLISYYLSQVSTEVNSFSVCYKGYKDADESVYAERVAKKLGINYNLCYFEDSLVQENFLEMLNYLDEPMADPAIIPLFYVSKFAKDKITVALSGDGGDEIFAGYPKYKAQNIIEKTKPFNFPLSLFKGFFRSDGGMYKILDNLRNPYWVRQFVFGSGSFSVGETLELLKIEGLDLADVFVESKGYFDMFSHKDVINKSLYLDCKIQLPDWYLVKGDRATMATSLEMRNPFLDKNLAEFMFSVPGDLKQKKGTSKYLLKKIASKYFDKDIIYRPKKGFGVPLDKWIRKDLYDLFNEYLFKNPELFNQNYVNKLFNEHLSGKRDHRFKLLRIFNFNYWYSNYYEKI